MVVRLKSIKNGISVGDPVPDRELHGNNGRYFERILIKNGHNISNGPGVDLVDLKTELKTRKSKSTSYHTIGTISIDNIINLSYEETHLYEKMLSQYRVKYDDDLQVVVSEKIYDFSDPMIQHTLKNAYEHARGEIINGDRSRYISCAPVGCFEKASTNSYQFRLSNGFMKSIEYIASSTYNKLFTES